MKRVGAGHIIFVLLTALVLFGCQKTGADDPIIEPTVSENDAVSDNVAMQEAGTDGVVVVVSEEHEEETPESLLLDDFLENLSSNYSHISSMPESSVPSGMSVEVTSGFEKDIFFANGTPIKILSPKTNIDDYEWDTSVQRALGNNLDSDNRGYGAVVTWQEGSKTKYVFVSNMVEIYGGSYKEDLHSNVNITVDGEGFWNAYPNISFLYGGCLEGDLVGNVNITIIQGRPMIMVGGGHNGSVFGDISISYDKNSWSMDIIGGGFADASVADSLALCYGNISIVMSTAESSSDANSLIGGGIAYTSSEYTAVADVLGDISLTIDGQSFKEICGGGVAVRLDENAELPVSNVFGNTDINITNSKILADGLLCESGLDKDGVAFVFGESTITDERLYFDRKAQGRVDHYYKLKDNKYYGSPITKAYESVNKANKYVDYEPTDKESVLNNAARLGFENGDITYAIAVSYVDGAYKLTLYNYSNDTFTTKEASSTMNIYQNIKDVQGINKRYKDEYFNELLEGNIQDYITNTKDIELYTAESYDPEKEKEYKIIVPELSAYLQWNGVE